MDRREALKRMTATASGLLLPTGLVQAQEKKMLYGGWVSSPAARRAFVKQHRHPFFSQQSQDIKGSSDGRIVMLNPFLAKALGRPIAPRIQEIGDCVGQAFALGVDVLTATQAFMLNRPERWVAECSASAIYGGARVNIGGGVLGRRAGANGHWAAEWLTRFGALLRQEYAGGHDFTDYSGELSKRLGYEGIPAELEILAKLHPVKTVSLVTTFEQVCDAIANGHPVSLCSSVGFGMTSDYWVRDSEGFLRRRGKWGHAMLGIGMNRKSRRKGVCIQNSWGDWITGPTAHGQPRGSFWCDESTINSILAQGDCHALSGYVGYPRVDIPDYEIW